MADHQTGEKAQRRARGRERRAAGCLGSVECPCLCHDTGGGSHHHHGRVCDGQPGEYVTPPGQPARDADHNPREEADTGARAGERGAEA